MSNAIQNDLQQLITKIECVPKDQGSGFFYTKNDIFWLVTARHVIQPKILLPGNDGEYDILENMTFYLQKLPIRLTRQEIEENIKVHSDKRIDIAVINISTKLTACTNQGIKLDFPATLTNEKSPSEPPTLRSEVIIASYPVDANDEQHYYEQTGKIVSGFACGMPCYLINDGKLTRLSGGSSGGLAIYQPTPMTDGTDIIEKPMILGVYGGRNTSELENVGVVWHANLISNIIENGVPCIPAVTA